MADSPALTTHIYDDAEVLAVQILREAAAEDQPQPGYSFSRSVYDHLLSFQDKHGTTGVLAVAISLARFGVTALTGPAVPLADLAGFIDQWEMHKIEQHQWEKDNPEDGMAAAGGEAIRNQEAREPGADDT